jgi:hypothetical protein
MKVDVPYIVLEDAPDGYNIKKGDIVILARDGSLRCVGSSEYLTNYPPLNVAFDAEGVKKRIKILTELKAEAQLQVGIAEGMLSSATKKVALGRQWYKDMLAINRSIVEGHQHNIDHHEILLRENS